VFDLSTLPLSTGTGSSNPPSSSGESIANLSTGGCRPPIDEAIAERSSIEVAAVSPAASRSLRRNDRRLIVAVISAVTGWESATSSVSTQNSAPSVFDRRHASTARLTQSMITTR
jgi:hypothetical protein